MENSELVQDIENCIIRTNSVVNRWITKNNVGLNKIYTDDVKSLFLGYLRKAITKHSKAAEQDFRKISSDVSLTISSESKLITHIIFSKERLYYWNKQLINDIYEAFKQIDCINLQNVLLEDEPIPTHNAFNLESLKNIKF